MHYSDSEELPLMLWKNSIHDRVRTFCSIVERTPYFVMVSQIDDLKLLKLTYPALSLVDTIARTGYFDKDQYELEAELGRYWWIHPETNQVEVFKFSRLDEEKGKMPEVAQVLRHLFCGHNIY